MAAIIDGPEGAKLEGKALEEELQKQEPEDIECHGSLSLRGFGITDGQ